MENLKKTAKIILPERFIRFASGIIYGWHGNYTSWDEAGKKCTGYDTRNILDNVKASMLKVKDGTAGYERDSVLFNEVEYSFPLLSALMWVAAQSNGKLNILDYGGSLGSTYYQNKMFLDAIPEVNWCIVEQPEFVKTGLESFEDEKLHFFNTIEECLNSFNINIVLLSSVLQYLEKPLEMLERIKSEDIRFLLIDRTPFIRGKDRITIQKVNPQIYKASYPCWFFNESDFVSRLSGSYKKVFEFDALDKANIRSEFKGFLFQKYDVKVLQE